jgi:hypothetical protein
MHVPVKVRVFCLSGTLFKELNYRCVQIFVFLKARYPKCFYMHFAEEKERKGETKKWLRKQKLASLTEKCWR